MSYNPDKWASHLFDIDGSLVRETMGRVIVCVAWATVVVVLYDFGPEFFDNMAIYETAHAMIGPSLGLLLVFRTNASYDRFWEGRKMWGGIVNETRNLSRQVETWFAKDRELAMTTIRWTIGWAHATKNRLRGIATVGPAELGLPAADVQAVENTSHIPLAIARKLTGLIHEARQRELIDSLQLTALDQNVQLLIDYCGACERIRSTPAPFGYVVHLRRALIIYCLTLPLALVRQYHWEAIIATLLISFILFGIEEIGVEIENPFDQTINDLPLEKICGTIDTDLRCIVDQTPQTL